MATRKLTRKSIGALSFDGAGTTATVASLVGGGPANNFTSVCLEFRPMDKTNRTIAVLEGSSTKIEFVLSGTRLLVRNNAGSNIVATNVYTDPGVFYKIVYTYSGTNHSVYAWNVTTATNATAADSGTITYAKVGNNSANSATYFKGIVSKFAYYNRILSAAEIDQFLTNRLESFTGAVIDLPFNNIGSTTASDISGNGNHATIASGTWTDPRYGNTPGPIEGRTNYRNVIYNGDLSRVPETNVKTTTSLRWINGTTTGSLNDNSYGFYCGFTNSGSAMYDTTVKHNEFNSIKLATEGTNGFVSANRIIQSGNDTALLHILPSATYRFRAWIKTQNAGPDGVYIKFINISGPSNGAGSSSSYAPVKYSGDNDWTLLEFTMTTGVYTCWMNMELHCDSNGNDAIAWFADMSMVQYGPPIRPDKKTTPLINGHWGLAMPFDVAGTNPSDTTIINYLTDVQSIGMDTVRMSTAWSYIKGSAGSPYNYHVYDNFVNIAVGMGFTVLPIVSGPNWTAYNTQEWHDYYQNMSAHFEPLGVDHFEYYNEPNLTSIYQSDCSPEHYWSAFGGDLGSSQGLRHGNPNCKVVMGGLTGNSLEANDDSSGWSAYLFTKRLYELGLKGYYDVMNYHPYDWNDAVFQAIFQLMADHGDGDLPMWITEYGLATGGSGFPRPGSLDEQSENVIKAITKCHRWYPKIDHCIFYNYMDSNSASGTSVEQHFGWKYDDLTPKPAWIVGSAAIANGTR